MSITTKPKSDASSSAIGYLYQCRFALLHVLRGRDETARQISIEKLDDVAEADVDSKLDDLSHIDMFQLKHHVNRNGGTTDSHKDVWKTLKIWAESVWSGKVNLDDARFFLVTTSTAADTHAISKLRDDEGRDTEAARSKLEAAGAKSNNDTVESAFKSLSRLSIDRRRKLFRRVYLFDDSSDITEIRSSLESAVWQAVDKPFAPAFVDQLEGWWFNEVILHLFDPDSAFIPLESIHNQVRALRNQFRSDSLPADFLTEPVPESETTEEDNRVFVKQLSHIGINKNRIRKAQENHYRAFAQRAKWLRTELLHISELEQFEAKLEMEWSEFFQIMLDDFREDVSASEIKKAARDLYQWSQAIAPDKQSLFIRPSFSAAYLTRGSYHMLADQVRIGWHPDYQQLFEDVGGNE